MKKIVLTFGLIAGAVMSALMLLSLPFQDADGLDHSMIVGYASMVLAFLMIYFGVRSYRDNVAGGSVGFWRALAVGASIALVASLMYVATWEVVFFTGKRDFLVKYQAHELEKARAAGESAESLARKKAKMDSFAILYQNPLVNAAVTLLEPMPVALVVALVSAGVLSRRKKTPLGSPDVVGVPIEA